MNANEDEQDFLNIFLLSGWGEPGAADAEDAVEDPGGKRKWTCWCAVHRPPPLTYSGSHGSKNIIIMEFEFERDQLNPLYPPFQLEAQNLSGRSSATSSGQTSHGSSTDDTERTLVSGDNAGALDSATEIASNSNRNPDTTTQGNNATTSSSLNNSLTVGLDALGPVQPETRLAGLAGDDDFVPNTGDIMESTISRSKPLPALERLRRATRATAPNSNSLSVSSSPGSDSTIRSRRARRRATTGSDSSFASGARSGTGMMDVLAVLAQMNEQLGAAPDLDSFLKVLVGIVKDLTQFHRVLVYQFDEVWNGQVVAELVDWSMTHDLYRGLHFPAGDIPAQVRNLSLQVSAQIGSSFRLESCT